MLEAVVSLPGLYAPFGKALGPLRPPVTGFSFGPALRVSGVVKLYRYGGREGLSAPEVVPRARA